MAQHSKKDQIAQAALAIFLEHGIKGTSIDMIVKTAGVSKPTVYNHFPDKANLFYHTLALWLAEQPKPRFKARTEKGLMNELSKTWLNNDTLRFYGLLMGEGFRVPQAKQNFSQSYDLLWRQALTQWSEQYRCDAQALSHQVNSMIIHALL